MGIDGARPCRADRAHLGFDNVPSLAGFVGGFVLME
jgi:hypothetical protein